ncbi:hypothetical protein GW17_00055319, partial [Ensete ventricosum]
PIVDRYTDQPLSGGTVKRRSIEEKSEGKKKKKKEEEANKKRYLEPSSPARCRRPSPARCCHPRIAHELLPSSLPAGRPWAIFLPAWGEEIEAMSPFFLFFS